MHHSRNLAAVIAAVAILICSGGVTLGQTSPDLMRSGTVFGTGTTEQVVITVPSGYYFVLTDFEWNPEDLAPLVAFVATVGIFGIFGGSIIGCFDSCFQNATDHSWPARHHLTTGLVFEPGTSVFGWINTTPSIDWDYLWSGYLVPVGVSGLQGPAEPVPGFAIMSRPNPTGDGTTFEFQLPASGKVIVGIFDVGGRKVRALHEGELAAGPQTLVWDGKDDSGRYVAAGIYFARVDTPGGAASRAITILH